VSLPVPETTRAVLPHARTGIPTWHQYVSTVPVDLPDRTYTERNGSLQVMRGGPAWQFMFESEDPDPEDRSLRPWGLQVSKREDGIHDQ